MPALKRHLGRFQAVTGRGVERWAAIFAWTVVRAEHHGIDISRIQAASAYTTEDGSRHKLMLMLLGDEFVYLLDVQRAESDIQMGIVSKREAGINEKWPGWDD